MDVMEQLSGTYISSFTLLHAQISTAIGSAAISPANFDFWNLGMLASLQIHLFKLLCDYDFYHKKRKAERI